jgi:hypothetical protein
MSSSSAAAARMYGGWRRAKGLGIGGLGPSQTVIVVGAMLVPIGIVNLNGLRSLLFSLPVSMTVITVTVWQRHGVPLLDLAVAWARWTWGAWRGETTYRGLALAHPQGLDLPGVLAPTALLKVTDPLNAGRSVGVVWNRRTGQMSATVLVSPAGTLLADRSQVASQVTSWGELLAALANEDLLDAVTVTVQVTPSSGAALSDHVRDRVDPEAPDLALTTMQALVAAAPAASAQMAAWVTVVASPDRSPEHPDGPVEAAAETLRCLDALDLAPAGADVIRPATDRDLVRLVRGAYRPSDRDAPAEDWQEIGWHEAGPVAAEEAWDRYLHDGGISVSWVLREAPRRPVPDSVLLALLAPGRFTRRVTLGYRVLATEEAAAVVERQLVAADARQAYRVRTQRTATRRERADASAAERAADEEAYGAGVTQWSVTVTTTVTEAGDLPAAMRELEQAAKRAGGLRFRLAYGGQAAAFVAGLPVGVHPLA